MYKYDMMLNRYFFTKSGVIPTGMSVIMNVLYPKEVRDILMLRCPFCGRRFRSRGYLATHLYHGECGFAYKSMVIDIVRIYKMIRYGMVRNKGNGRVYVYLDGKRKRFDNLYDAYLYALKYLIKKGKV